MSGKSTGGGLRSSAKHLKVGGKGLRGLDLQRRAGGPEPEQQGKLRIASIKRMPKGCHNSIAVVFYSSFFLRRLRRIEDLKVHLAVVADLERSLEANGSIDVKSLEDIGRKEEYEIELKSLEEMKL